MVAPFIRGAGRFIAGRRGALPPLPASIVEPPVPLPGIRRAAINPDPQDIQFVSPVRPVPEPLPPAPWQEPISVPRPRQGYDARDYTSTYIDPSAGRYIPLPPEQVQRVLAAAAESPSGTAFEVLNLLDSAANPQQFGLALEAAALTRPYVRGVTEIEKLMDAAVGKAARRFNIPEDVYNPILYRNSPDMPGDIAASVGRVQDDWRKALTDSDKFRVDTRKAIANTQKSSDLAKFDAANNGGLITRALNSGEIVPDDAVRLIDQVNYRRIALLKKEGIVSASIKNDVRSKGGVRGLALISDTSTLGTEGRKVQVYKAALHTAETPDEVAQVLALARRDLRSPAFLDEVDEIAGIRGEMLMRLEGVEPARLPRRVSTTVDEDAIRQADRAQTDLDAQRFEADRPENLGDIVRTPKLDSEGNVVKDALGQTVMESWEQFGGGQSRLIDRSLFVAPKPRPGVTPTEIRLAPQGTGYVERTVYNAQNSDATIAVARNFESPGEILTANAARGRVGVQFDSRGKARTFYPPPGQPNPGRQTPIFQIAHGDVNYSSSVDDIVNELNKIYALKGKPVTVNFAGNSLASLGDGTLQGARQSQLDANAFARRLLDSIMDHPNRNFEIGLARSGGQHGYDTAFIKAASDNGIPTGVRHPSGQYGGVMVSNPIDEAAMPMFMDEKQYLRFANGDIDSFIGKAK